MASRSLSPELALSWWKRGHADGVQAWALVRYALMYPERVSEITTLCDESAVSRVPNEPIVGLATVQSVVSFGHPGSSLPAALKAFRSMLAVPSTISWPGAPSRSATDGPVRNWRSFTACGKLGRSCPPPLTFQAARKSCPVG